MQVSKSASLTLILAMLALASACASLRVQVAVLDPEQWYAEEDKKSIRDHLPEVLAQNDAMLTREINELRDPHWQAYVNLSELYMTAAESLPEGAERGRLTELATSLQADFPDTMGNVYGQAETSVAALNAEIRGLSAQRDAAKEPDTGLDRRIVAKLVQRSEVLAGLEKVVREDLDSLPTDVRKELAGIEDEARREALLASSGTTIESVLSTKRALERSLSRSPLFGEPLHDSPYAYAVASAPEKLWEESYERVYGKGVFGNLNVAIRRLEQGGFTLKGLTFDPSDVARAAARVSTQALLLSAQIAGVPVNLSSTPQGDGAALAKSSASLAQSRKDLVDAKTRMVGFQDALRLLAESILQERAQIEGDSAGPATRREALDAIIGTYEANKERLQAADG